MAAVSGLDGFSTLIPIFVLGAIRRKPFSLLWKLGLLEKSFVSRMRKVNSYAVKSFLRLTM